MLKQEGYDLMGAAFEVYNELGYGMADDVYQSALEVELGLRDIGFVAQVELDIFFKGNLLNAKYRPDLLVFGEIVVELKALKELCSEHEAQLFNYMRIARKRAFKFNGVDSTGSRSHSLVLLSHAYPLRPTGHRDWGNPAPGRPYRLTKRSQRSNHPPRSNR